nr:uncharacterized protein LOC129531469 [Gorilla gorilla gorilla]
MSPWPLRNPAPQQKVSSRAVAAGSCNPSFCCLAVVAWQLENESTSDWSPAATNKIGRGPPLQPIRLVTGHSSEPMGNLLRVYKPQKILSPGSLNSCSASSHLVECTLIFNKSLLSLLHSFIALLCILSNYLFKMPRTWTICSQDPPPGYELPIISLDLTTPFLSTFKNLGAWFRGVITGYRDYCINCYSKCVHARHHCICSWLSAVLQWLHVIFPHPECYK